MADGRGRGAVPRRGRVGRTAKVAGLGARSGGRWATAKARQVFADAQRTEALDAERELRTAADVVEVLGNMKGALMKIGQMASYLDVGLPETTRTSLAQLQANAPPMSPALAESVVAAELGAPPGELFEQWDPVPIAAASIGQVHRAITADGRACAVKIQYPGVAEAIAADLGSARMIFRALSVLFPGLDPAPIVEELRQRLTEELDYEHEASNQRLFADHYNGHPYISVPEVFDDLSSARVLTAELAVGATFEEVLGWPQDQRNRVAETIYRFSFGSIYRLWAFNGDPHPGNYLFGPDGSVVFLDFGLVKRFTPEETAQFERMLTAMVIDRDIPRFRSEQVAAGLLPADAPFSDDEVEAFFTHFYEFVLTDETRTFTPEYAAAGVRAIFDATGEHAELKKVLNVPPSLVVLQRINLGLISLFAQLGATANWRRIAEELWPFTDRAPSTPMGLEAQPWRQSLQQ
ncbi:ABC1 kinase family protein [Candidatus Poriferisocius sp.]|uniref:ABC1 kinase family protein n=1 Tax=Candidatus Poriferisocius sp. TaxID=3101276 RepID=UPI003B53049E